MAILVTGAAGFIGYHVAQSLLDRGERVVGIDCLNDYYDVRLKHARLRRLEAKPGFTFQKIDIADRDAVFEFIASQRDIDGIVHLAAQAGVRYSLVNPYAYIQSNVMGHLVIQEAARRIDGLKHLVYASSSSVYGSNRKLPFEETDPVDTPVSLYAATKRANELMSHVYGHLFDLPQTGLRFFTVYGPWGRPDMAYFSFARAITRGEPIQVYGDGLLKRDFTYIDDDIKADAARLDIREVAYDPWQASQLSQRMTAEGMAMIEYRQTVQNMSEPMKELEKLVLQGRFHFNGDPVLTWMISNVVAHLDAKENIYPRKERPENKIDGVVALIMALGRAIFFDSSKSPGDDYRLITV